MRSVKNRLRQNALSIICTPDSNELHWKKNYDMRCNKKVQNQLKEEVCSWFLCIVHSGFSIAMHPRHKSNASKECI